MKQLLKQLEAAEQESTRLELQLESELEEGNFNEETEKAFDEAYKKEFELYTSLAKEIVKSSENKIDFETAKKLIKGKRAELKALLQKMA